MPRTVMKPLSLLFQYPAGNDRAVGLGEDVKKDGGEAAGFPSRVARFLVASALLFIESA